MNVREEIRSSDAILESRIQALGGGGAAVATAYREKVREMAQNGCLALLGRILRFHCEGYGNDVLNTQIPVEECALARGGLVALRGYWKEILHLAVEEEEVAPPQPTTEMNTFAILPELAGP